jgi:hypothetical protein
MPEAGWFLTEISELRRKARLQLSAGAFANILFQNGILTPEEFARKMDEVAGRWAKQVRRQGRRIRRVE